MAKKQNVLGAWAFLIGVILAVVVGLLGLGATEGTYALVLVILGIIIGLLNIGGPELKEFLMASAVLVIVSSLGGQTYLSMIPYVGDIIKALVVLFVPATVVVALKAVFALAKR
ncbi:MAG: hypothetical protein AABX71_03005 [Nanoarchaeota archaeon]